MYNVAVYIDGFNLYYGLKAKHRRQFLWLDLAAVSQRLLRPDQTLVAVRYFTASVRNDPKAEARQNAYLGALRTSTAVDVVLGRFQAKKRTCARCGIPWQTSRRPTGEIFPTRSNAIRVQRHPPPAPRRS